jgi:hypothetical protein
VAYPPGFELGVDPFDRGAKPLDLLLEFGAGVAWFLLAG